MKRSTNNSHHLWEAPRPANLEMNTAKISGRPYDQTAWTARVRTAVSEVVRLQVEAGVDIVNEESFQSRAGRATSMSA